jgi:PKHD-type hydroxylase
MLYILKHVLGPRELSTVQKLLSGARFIDGRLSAGLLAQAVKHNTEMASNDPLTAELNQCIMNNLTHHKKYLKAARPVAIAQPFYARYEAGMEYGTHIDDPIMGSESQHYRSDLAITLFLNEPDEYDGGELVIEHSLGENAVKCAAGDAVLYPATTLHRVTPVTRGQRLVAVTWVQSSVRNHEQRELLFQLDQALSALLRKQPDLEHTRRIQYVYANLVRQWSDV